MARRLLMVLWLAGLTGCGGERSDGPAPFLSLACGDETWLVVFADDAASLVTSGGLRRLPRVRSASGTLYSNGTDSLWTKGDEAMLTVDGRTLRDCRRSGRQQLLEDLRRDGALFTAGGNDPTWSFAAFADSLVLVVGLGHERHVVREGNWRGADWSRPQTWLADDASAFSIVTNDLPCRGSRNGELYPMRVEVRLAGDRLNGCGLALR